MKKLLGALGLCLAFVASTGCTLYFGEDDGDDDWGDECPPGTYLSYDEYGAVCLPDDGGVYGCTNDYECAAGCYCDLDSGACIEAGYCTTDADCGEGLECDEDRQSCTPITPPTTCETDADCGFGNYCDEATGTCVPSTTCDPADPTTCGDGFVCEEGTCVPAPPLPACEELTTEAECALRDECSAVFKGLNCTDPDGGSCTDGEAMCECESFIFDECVTTPTSPLAP